MDLDALFLDSGSLAARILEDGPSAVVITDGAGEIVGVNSAFTRVTGYTEAEALGRTPGDLLQSGRQDADFYRVFWDTLKRDGRWEGQLWSRRKSGEVYPEWLTITGIANAQGDTTHYVGVFADITETKTADVRLERMAYHDALTGLPNRALGLERLQHAIKRSVRERVGGAVCFLDLDGFKRVNDLHGHEAGDALLIAVSRALEAAVRAPDTVARFGGDEFLVVLERVQDAASAQATAHRLMAALTAVEGPAGSHAEGSVGVAFWVGAAEAQQLVQRADEAMYRAKQGGGGQVALGRADPRG